MRKWIVRAAMVAVIGFVGYGAYDYYRAGLHTRPEMPPDAFSLSFKGGMRGIMVDVPDDRETRRYRAYPSDVPSYMEFAWSTCSTPTNEEAPHVERWMTENHVPGNRFEAVCRIEVDDETVVRGFITSVPRL